VGWWGFRIREGIGNWWVSIAKSMAMLMSMLQSMSREFEMDLANDLVVVDNEEIDDDDERTTSRMLWLVGASLQNLD
jgi:hypothetical protein